MDRLIRTNAELGRLDDLYRAVIAVVPGVDTHLLEQEHRHLNALYMDLLVYIRKILRRQKYLHRLLEEYQKEKMEFKMHLLDQLTYLRTNEQTEVCLDGKPRRSLQTAGNLWQLQYHRGL